MRVLGMYAVMDIIAGVFMAPYTARTKGEAIRMFTDAVNGGQSPMGEHPDDYVLHELGTFDSVGGVLEQPLGWPCRVISARECKVVAS